MTSAPLHLLRLDLDLPQLFALCERQRLPRIDDTGHAIHCGLAAVFGDAAPSCFAVTRQAGRGRMVEVLAYSPLPLAELRAHADIYAEPDAFRIVDWQHAADKPMPTSWRVGQRLGYCVRACPTVRTAKAGPSARAGAEVDAFLAAARRDPDGPKPDRELVYQEWLRAAMARSEAVRVDEVTVERFELQALLRRTQGDQRRAKAGLRKPDVTFTGVLEVVDPDAFDRLLRRGVGRHRAFGFGMLLLRPPRRSAC